MEQLKHKNIMKPKVVTNFMLTAQNFKASCKDCVREAEEFLSYYCNSICIFIYYFLLYEACSSRRGGRVDCPSDNAA